MDIKAAESGADSRGGGSDFVELATLLRQRSLLKAELEAQQSIVTLYEQMISYTTLSMGSSATSVLGNLMQDAATARTGVTTTVSIVLLS